MTHNAHSERRGDSLDEVVDDNGVRWGQKWLQASWDLSKPHARNLKDLQDTTTESWERNKSPEDTG